GGPTVLTSAPIDLAGVEGAELSLAVWYANDDGDDPFTIEISADGNTWVTAWQTVGGGGGWQIVSFMVDDYITPSANVQLRFTAADEPNDSVTEAAIDAISIRALICEDCGGDWNGDTVLDIFDITSYLADFDAQTSASDLNGDDAWDIFDVLEFLELFDAGC
ncbi:MAG: hypothetical protein KDA28_17735, partial [Phycisphaerales bacterium]|nr:hypothetical protein [Phycisphaerales bacterium]